jgi:hypothetical protein
MDMVHFLSHGVPLDELSKAEPKRLGVCSRAFNLMNGGLYHKLADGVWRCVVWKDEQMDVLWECHSAVAGGHYGTDGLAEQVMVANDVAGRTPIHEGVRRVPKNGATTGVGMDAASACSSARTFLEVGPRLCRTI